MQLNPDLQAAALWLFSHTGTVHPPSHHTDIVPRGCPSNISK
jgi:hypothetical protein